MYLTDSAQTGAKIMKNIEKFDFNFLEVKQLSDSTLYCFKWRFDKQHGFISIPVKDGKISNSSLINTYDNSPHPFGRPLGLYNDPSLEDLFTLMMRRHGVSISGVYAETF